jgi:hypothetical protein
MMSSASTAVLRDHEARPGIRGACTQAFSSFPDITAFSFAANNPQLVSMVAEFAVRTAITLHLNHR